MLKYGRGSIHSTQQLLDDICRDLHCQRDRYTWTSHPALEGTFCGTNKVNIMTLHSIQNSDNIFQVLLIIKIQISVTKVTKCKLHMISLNFITQLLLGYGEKTNYFENQICRVMTAL